AHGLARRLQGRFFHLLIGILFAKGRRPATAWFRAAGIADDYRQAYRTLAAAGRDADFLATCPLHVVRSLEPGPCLTVGLDDTPTPRWGPCVQGAGIHHNPTPGPAGEQYVYGHVWVTLAALVQHPHEGARALPLHSALYVRAKDVTAELTAQGWRFATKLELAGQQLRWLRTWAGHSVELIRVVADGAYAKRPLLRVVRQLGMVMV